MCAYWFVCLYIWFDVLWFCGLGFGVSGLCWVWDLVCCLMVLLYVRTVVCCVWIVVGVFAVSCLRCLLGCWCFVLWVNFVFLIVGWYRIHLTFMYYYGFVIC